MTPEQAEIARLSVRLRLHRDLIAWIVASLANQEADPNATLRVVSEFLSAKIDGLPDQEYAAAMRSELDAIVADARRGLQT